jgi:tetratricopeptide (TPR) repeat protein
MPDLPRRLPLQVALGALVLYTLTLSHGVTMNSLALTAKIAGWNSEPMLGQPLLWLLTLPLRLLPEAWTAWELNFFSAVIAALTLGLLARSIQLLPWNKPWENAQAGALPVLLACVLCGLEFNFWQEATAATGEMLDLLLLATSVWLLLEYRVRRESRWVNAAAFVWGLGMTENWLMLLTLPIFVVSLIWLRKRHFLRPSFLLRMAGLGLAGFSFYVLLPLANGLNPHSPWSLGQAWLASLRQSKNLIQIFYHQFWMSHQLVTLAVAVYFLVPTLACLVRLREDGVKNKSRVERFQLWIYWRVRLALLLACLVLAFDPVIGPRQILHQQLGVSMPLLTFDYLNAVGAAFLAGNLMLISQRAGLRRQRSKNKIKWRQLEFPFGAACLGLLILGLVGKNAGAILNPNFHPLQRFGELAFESLPAGPGIMLADEPQKLWVFQAALAHQRRRADWLAVDTHQLPNVAYRARLEHRRALGWLTDENRHELSPIETTHLLEQIARTNRLFYLHPSYGAFFERFYLEPNGASYKMILRESQNPELPQLSAAVVNANENFWNNAWQNELEPLVPAAARRLTDRQIKLEKLGFTRTPRIQNLLLADWYSMTLDGWGVMLQGQGRWSGSQQRLEQALQLNTNNFSARISLVCNTNLQSGRKLGLAELHTVAGQLENPRRLSLLMNQCGPFDEPVFCYLLGCTYAQSGLLLQAARQFERTRSLAPGVPAPEFALADVYTRLQQTDRARPIISHLRDEAKKISADGAVDFELAVLEANFWLAQTNIANARNALQSVLQQHPDDPQIRNRVMSAYLAFGDFTNALQIVNAQLDQSPDDVPGLNRQAAILIQSGNPAAAIPVLNRVLTLTNQPMARLNRAIAQLACQDFAAAETDFRDLDKSGWEPGRVNYGLAAIAEQRHDTNQIVHCLRLCLSNTPAGTLFWHEASIRLQRLGADPSAR